MHALITGGRTDDPRDAARFPVLSFAERRAEAQRFEARQEALRARIAENRGADTRPPSEPGAGHPADGVAGTPPRTGLTDRLAMPASSASAWLARRDRDRTSLRERARDRLSPVTAVAGAGRAIRGRLAQGQGQLRDVDRRLADSGVSDQERADIRREMGGDRLDAVAGPLGRATTAADTPMRAVERIDRAWEGRRDAIAGALDRVGPYAEARDRRLGLDTGGSGNLFERMRRNREQALERRREAMQADIRDEARRTRAARVRRDREPLDR